MKRPVLWGLGFLICGIILGYYATLPLISLGFLAGLFLCLILYKHYKYVPVFIFLLFFVAGAWRVSVSLHTINTEQRQADISGTVIDVGITSGGNQRVMIRDGNGVRFIAYVAPHLPWAALGQQISVSGELRPLSLPQNPGGYNQFRHLRPLKVDAVIWPDAVELGDVRLSLMVVLRSFRDRLADVYEQILPPREAAVVRSMVLGDRADMDAHLAEQYRTMGIFHILSISGLHVAVLMMAFNKALGLFISERKSGVIVLAIMVLYCLMTGAAVSTVRAVTMGGFLVFGKVLHREYDLLASVAWACVVLLVYEPMYLFNVGFQLSFVAVFGIGIMTEPVDRLLAKIKMPKWGGFRKSLAFGIGVVAATYPVFAFHFYEIALYSVIGNLIIAPTTAIILILGFVVGLVGLVWIGGAAFLGGTVYYILRFYDIASQFFANLPFAMLLTGGGNLLVAGLGAAVLLSFAFAFNGFGEVFRKRLVLFYVMAVLLVGVVFVQHNPRGVHVTELDTAGNYSVVRHRGDVLIIGAPQGGEHALFTYLDMRGASRANGFIMTELPRPQDVNRLVRLAERVDVFYVVGEADGIVLFVLEEVRRETDNMPEVVFLQDGDVRRVGRKGVRVAIDGVYIE